MSADLTWWWLASRNNVEYVSDFTVVVLKSAGMMKMPRTKTMAPIVNSRRRASGAMGLSPPGMYFL